jgi:hypothetical protein
MEEKHPGLPLSAIAWKKQTGYRMSSLVRRLATTGTDGEVANALVCKTSIHGFKSHSVLQIQQ